MKMRKKVSALLAVMAGTSLLAGGTVNVKAADEPYELYMNFPTFGTAPAEEEMEKVEEYVSSLAQEQGVNVKIVLQPAPVFNMESENNLTISAGDKLDLVLTIWSGGFMNYIDKGAIIPLDDLYENYGKEMNEIIGTAIESGYYDGELYGIPEVREMGVQYAYQVRSDIFDEFVSATGFEYDKDKVYSLDELETILDWIHTNYPDMKLFAGTGAGVDNYGLLYTCDSLGFSTNATGGLRLDGSGDTTVKNIYATQEYEEYAERMYDWAQKGWFTPNDATNEDDATVQLPTGDYAGWLNIAGSTNFVADQYGYDLVPIKLTELTARMSILSDIQWGISVNCEEPELAMQFLNLMYTDNRISTALVWGLEGETYEVVEEGEDGYQLLKFVDGVDATNAPYYTQFGVYGNPAMIPENVSSTSMEDHKALGEFNALALENAEKLGVPLGYRFNYSNLTSEVSALQAVVNQYVSLISYGTESPDVLLPEFLKALEDARIDEVIAENQSQLDAWLKAQ